MNLIFILSIVTTIIVFTNNQKNYINLISFILLCLPFYANLRNVCRMHNFNILIKYLIQKTLEAFSDVWVLKLTNTGLEQSQGKYMGGKDWREYITGCDGMIRYEYYTTTELEDENKFRKYKNLNRAEYLEKNTIRMDRLDNKFYNFYKIYDSHYILVFKDDRDIHYIEAKMPDRITADHIIYRHGLDWNLDFIKNENIYMITKYSDNNVDGNIHKLNIHERIKYDLISYESKIIDEKTKKHFRKLKKTFNLHEMNERDIFRHNEESIDIRMIILYNMINLPLFLLKYMLYIIFYFLTPIIKPLLKIDENIEHYYMCLYNYLRDYSKDCKILGNISGMYYISGIKLELNDNFYSQCYKNISKKYNFIIELFIKKINQKTLKINKLEIHLKLNRSVFFQSFKCNRNKI